MTEAEQVAGDALRAAGLDELADNLKWAREAVRYKLETEARDVALAKLKAERLAAADEMRVAMTDMQFRNHVHQSGDDGTMCGGDMPPIAPGKWRVTCPACLHILFGPGTDGR